VEQSWESSARWNEVGGILLGGTKLGEFYLVERSWKSSTRWNEVGGILLGGTNLVGLNR